MTTRDKVLDADRPRQIVNGDHAKAGHDGPLALQRNRFAPLLLHVRIRVLHLYDHRRAGLSASVR